VGSKLGLDLPKVRPLGVGLGVRRLASLYRG